MPRRFIKESICTSDTLDQVSAEAERLFIRLIVQCDDYGRFDGRAAVIASRCFPLKRSLEDDVVQIWLDELSDADLLSLYTVDGRRYLQMTTWSKHQSVRAKESKYPPMDEADCSCAQVRADESSRAQMAPYSYSNSYSKSQSDASRAREDCDGDDIGLAPDDDAVDEATADFRRVMAATQECGWKLPSGKDEREASDLIADYGASWVVAAIERAHERGRTAWGYVKGILGDWRAKGGIDGIITGAGPPSTGKGYFVEVVGGKTYEMGKEAFDEERRYSSLRPDVQIEVLAPNRVRIRKEVAGACGAVTPMQSGP